jgi:hypothetical protein
MRTKLQGGIELRTYLQALGGDTDTSGITFRPKVAVYNWLSLAHERAKDFGARRQRGGQPYEVSAEAFALWHSGYE